MPTPRRAAASLLALGLSLAPRAPLLAQAPPAASSGNRPSPPPATSGNHPPAQAPLPSPPAASGAPAAPPAPPAPEALAQAKDLFRRGNSLLQAHEVELALELFLQSRALVPGVGNTMNAAICLDQLGRFDEALQYYEAVLRELPDKLGEEERRSVSAAMQGLRRKVGSIDVAANVEGTLVIDGRKRGDLPLTAPVRVMPGSHTVRVVKDGYAPAEAVVSVKIGEERSVDLRLEVLTSSGRLRVTDESKAAAVEVIVDGAPVGSTPWEGTLGAGRHVVALRGKDVGTAPTATTVVAGQTVSLALSSVAIGPPLRLDPDPLTATVVLDDVVLGQGPWEGRLPVGPHTARIVEEGYVTRTLSLDPSSRGLLHVALEIDDDHPRWRKETPIVVRAEAFGGFGLSGSLGSDAEASCPGSCSRTGGPSAVLVGARAGVVLPVGLRFDLGGGFLRATASLDRTLDAARVAPGASPHRYALSDELRLSGPFAALGVGYALPLGKTFRLTGRASVGAYFASARDRVSGSAVRGGESVEVFVENSGKSTTAVDFFVMPELGGEAKLGKWHLGLSLGLGFFLLDGPRSPLGDTQITRVAACDGKPQTLACVASDPGRAGERPYGAFRLWVPQLSVGYSF